MAPTALRDATITIAAVPTPSQMRGPAAQVVAATIEISTDTDMYLRNASMRGVIVAYDMIQTPPTRVAIVTTANRMTAPIAAMPSTMPPHSHDASRQRAGNDVPARRQDIRAGDRDSGGRDQRKQVRAALPLADDNSCEVGDHDSVEAEARQNAQQRTHERANGSAHDPHDPHGQTTTEQNAGVCLSAVPGGHGVREIRIAEEKQRRESAHDRNL